MYLLKQFFRLVDIKAMLDDNFAASVTIRTVRETQLMVTYFHI
jgi:hypothetical protein